VTDKGSPISGKQRKDKIYGRLTDCFYWELDCGWKGSEHNCGEKNRAV